MTDTDTDSDTDLEADTNAESDMSTDTETGRNAHLGTDTGKPGETIGYAAALTELDSILRELDGDEVDVDVLGTRVRRAAELLRICRDRIASARFDVEQVVAELEADNTPSPPPEDL